MEQTRQIKGMKWFSKCVTDIQQASNCMSSNEENDMKRHQKKKKRKKEASKNKMNKSIIKQSPKPMVTRYCIRLVQQKDYSI